MLDPGGVTAGNLLICDSRGILHTGRSDLSG